MADSNRCGTYQSLSWTLMLVTDQEWLNNAHVVYLHGANVYLIVPLIMKHNIYNWSKHDQVRYHGISYSVTHCGVFNQTNIP